MTEPLQEPARPTTLDRLGPRGEHRAEPRASIAIAGAGCALAVLGVLIISGDRGAAGDDFNQWPGALLSAAVVVAGFATLSAVRSGAVATGGAVAALLGVPPLMFFLTYDEGGLPPYSTEAVLAVSAGVWLGAYAWSPGRGRPIFLGAGLLGLWATILQLSEKVFDAPYGFFGSFGFTSTGSSGFGDDVIEEGFVGPVFQVPDWTTVGGLSLVLGLAYLFATRYLDRRGLRGMATPFAAAALLPLLVGVVALADELEVEGTGLLLMALGVLLATHGSSLLRRGTTWIGGGTTALGAAVFLVEMTDDATVGGMLFLAAGIALVFAAHAYAMARDEPDEMQITRPLAAAAVGPPDEVPPPPPPEDDHAAWAPPADD